MKRSFRFLATTAAAIFSIYCFGCASGEASGGFSGCAPSRGEAFNFYAMNTAIYAEATDKPFNQNESENIRELFLSLEKEFSASLCDSFTARANGAAAGVATRISERGKTLLDISQKVYAVTGGAFDPTVLPLSELWGFYPSFPVADFAPPAEELISEILNSGVIGLNNISLTEEDGKFSVLKKADGTKIEFGGVLKGFAADEAGKILLGFGHTSGYVNAGGSSLFILSAPSLGVRHPRKSGENLLSFDISGRKNFSVSTSGDYEKVYTRDGENYCHVIDPKTGKPVKTGVAQVTIIGKSELFCGAFLDAVTTALMTKDFSSKEEAKSPLVTAINELLKENELDGATIFVVVIKGEEKTLLTNAATKDFTLFDKSFDVRQI